MNGDDGDDMAGAIGSGTDMGGGMFTEPSPPPSPTDDDDGLFKRKPSRKRVRQGRKAKRLRRRMRP
jgi:hypothetical protein